jgi:predicted nucleic acid-binding protein
MDILVDTNLLLRSIQPDHKQFPLATDALRILRPKVRLCIMPQTLYALWVVCTRPAGENGIGMDARGAKTELEKTRALFDFLPDSDAVYPEWERLVCKYEVKGKPAHDARLVAAMIVHQIPAILTFNDGDFTRYSEITVIPPQRAIVAH